MTLVDALLRWGWTALTGFGVLFALWNLREVLIDNWAISQVRTSQQRPVDVLKLQTRGAVWDHSLIFVVIAADFLAGVASLSAWAFGALLFLILSAAAAIALSFMQTQRRGRIFRALRLRPPREMQ